MNEIAIVRAIMAEKKMTQKIVADKLGFKTQSGVGNRLQGRTMSVETLVTMLAAMDCELVIRNKVGDKETYVVTNDGRKEK